MKKWLSVAAIVLLSLALVIGVACGDGGEEAEEGVTELKIGIGEPLTGVYGALVGIPCKHGFSLIAESIGVFEVGGKEYQWKTIFEDNQGGTASGGVASASKLIFEHDVDFMHQTGGGAAMGAQDLCEESGILLDMGCTPFRALGPDYPHTFQAGICIQEQVAAFYDWLAKEHPEVQRIVVVVVDAGIGAAYNEAYESKMHEYFGFEREIIYYSEATVEYYPVATKVMALHPDLVLANVQIVDILWDMGYKGLAASATPLMDLKLLDDAGWDDFKGFIWFLPEWYADVWPEATAFAEAYEDRYGVECGTIGLWPCMDLQILTGALQEAGTVDDIEKIRQAMESGASFDTLLGPIHFGGEAFVGINLVSMWPVAICQVVGDHEYRQLAYYTPEEAEAVAVEAWEATMK